MTRQTNTFAWNRRAPAAALISLGFALVLGGCATAPLGRGADSTRGQVAGQEIAAAMHAGRPEAARALLTTALRADPQNGYLHLLNGLSYQLADDSQRSADLAQVGYDAAVKFAPGYYWSHYYAGLASFERKDYTAAAEAFAGAILDRPEAPQAFAGLAAAAYYGGDLDLARLAATRALALEPQDPQMLRTAAYVAAVRGEREELAAVIQRANALPQSRLTAHEPRLAQLQRTAMLLAVQEQEPPAATQGGADAVPGKTVESSALSPTAAVIPANNSPQQVMVEVTLLLSQDTTKQNVGINLLDGLKLQFGGENRTERRRATGTSDVFSRVITAGLTVPQINYSLNLFNTHDDFYDVVVRPSLVATLGQQSEFFIGRTLSVGISGINLGALQTIDVGTSVKLTPLEITPERTKFRIDTVRSFFVPASSGSFQQSVSTFKQTVGATAEVEFGKTLILSGLYEAVNVGWTSKVPVLGDLPIGNVLFNEREKTQSRDAAIVLVTPRLAGMIDTGTREFRTETLTNLLALWKELVDPLADMDALANKVRRKVFRHFGPQLGDLRLPAASDPGLVRQAIGDTLSRVAWR